ncbi:putative disease resistance protein [Cardamine amara subsp. amara]|uniref:Disease resistance protein n=1 Tax=Cardamine amara subsp. amara TaxID=228776 RepID=A0ABD1C529_CARAN
MGGCVSVAISCDQAVNSLTSCISGDRNPFHNLVDHVASLRTAVRQLEARGEDLLRRVKVQEDSGLSRFAEVKEWFSEVEITVRETHDLLLLGDEEIEKLCCSQYCSKSCISSDGYSKKVVKKLKEIEILLSRGVFDEVTQRGPIQKVEEKLFHQKIVGQEELIESTWNNIMENGVGILGIYGMGGVGKTTLLSQINNKFLIANNQFDIVIWVVVSKNTTVERIQEDIGKRLEIYNENWEKKTENEKACDINKYLQTKRYVLLLDDMWRKVDLAKVGIPVPKRNGSKIVFTTRSNDVCGRMGVDKEIKVTCMMWDDAWELFTKNMEENIKSHPDILEVARSVAKKCNGLPLALNVIGDVMARKKTVEEWHHAANVLSSSAVEFSGMEAEILSILKFSYDDLADEKTKACFLFCALFPEDYEVGKDDLIDYWVGHKFINGTRDKYEGYAIIGTLIDACLLMETESKDKVKMHDVIRDMALWIPSGVGGPQGQLVFVEENARETPKVKDQEALTSISLMCNRIEKACGSLNCPNLATVLLQDNRLRNISQEFFCRVPVLKVLDLSLNANLTRLPNISHLVSLRYLNLSCTGLKNLPDGLYELCELIYLNLEHTYMLKKIDGISALSSLQVLRLYGSGIDTSDHVVDEIRSLEHLYQLTITLRSSSGLESYLKDERLNELYNKQLYLSGQSCVFIVPVQMITSSRVLLEILDSDIPKLEIEWPSSHSEDDDVPEIDTPIFSKNRPRRRSEYRYGHLESKPAMNDWSSSSKFFSLREVRLDNCTSLQDLTCLLFAHQLAILYLVWLPDIRAIIKWKEMYARLTGIQPFGELEFLTVRNCGELCSIYWSPLPFPKLKEINIKGCPLLTELPINSKSANLQNVIMNAEKEWLEKVEWADEATKERFLPS